MKIPFAMDTECSGDLLYRVNCVVMQLTNNDHQHQWQMQIMLKTLREMD